MRSVNPTPGEYKYALTLGPGKGGLRKVTAQGLILCDGIFGLCGEIYGWTLTHIGTGRWVGRFPTRRKAYEAAAQLAALDLPWNAKSLKEWKARLNALEGKRATEIIERLGYR
ncbi:MAG: hypothetical protein WC565_05540 [Parcubacteria group bacterium]